ncbi:MAG: class II fructose-bisphosphate aldolase [bacterium]|nr:class II fructose-bisphosphate aldolase [bacterium]
MKTLREYIAEAVAKKIAIGHFNISDVAALHGIFSAAKDLGLPVIIGVSEGEREFLGAREAAALIKSLRDEYDYPIFLNADHTYSFEKIKEAVAAGFDMVIFDGAKLSLEDNITRTKEVAQYVKEKTNGLVLVEGELGYIGTSSKVLEAIPEGAAVMKEQFTKPAEAAKFVKETGVDMLAPAVGNIHGMFIPSGVEGLPEHGYDPDLDIELISKIRAACGVPLVLHGGSGTKDEQFIAAAEAGMAIIHINTELRVAWKNAMEATLKNNPDEVATYRLLTPSEKAVSAVVKNRLKLFSRL